MIGLYSWGGGGLTILSYNPVFASEFFLEALRAYASITFQMALRKIGLKNRELFDILLLIDL